MNLIKLFVLALFIVFAFLVTGCSTTVPVTAKFPAVPDILLEKCPQLMTIDDEKVSIIDYTKTVTVNYTTYYECAVKNDGWTEWYQKQKSIFNNLK
jgi:predicted nucleic-acid-binding Zn-ribbon protein